MINKCAFQYATSHKIIEDTNIISLDTAKGMFEKYKDDFIERLNNDECPEMAIWINMSNSSDYHTTLEHWHFADMKVIDGKLYQVVEIEC